MWSLTSTLRPAPPELMTVVVAARDLAPGTTITSGDLATATVPAQLLARDAGTDPATVLGRRVVVPLLAGDPVLVRHLLTASLLAGYGPGTVAAPLRLADESALAVLRPGDLVDVIAASSVGSVGSSGDRAAVVAARVRVLLTGSTASSGGGMLSAQTTGAPPSVVLATTSAQALEIARAAVGSRLSVVLRAE